MSTVPAAPPGEVAVHEVAEEQLTALAAMPPKLAAVPSTKPEPVMVTTVPPTSGPPPELTALIVGTTS